MARRSGCCGPPVAHCHVLHSLNKEKDTRHRTSSVERVRNRAVDGGGPCCIPMAHGGAHLQGGKKGGGGEGIVAFLWSSLRAEVGPLALASGNP
jgi:hypothetical protein